MDVGYVITQTQSAITFTAASADVLLCKLHHNGSNFGVHFDRKLDQFFKQDCQRRWEEREGIDEPNHESFIRLMGRNYL